MTLKQGQFLYVIMIELQNVLMELMNDSKMKMNKYVKYLIMMLAFVSCDGLKPASDANIC